MFQVISKCIRFSISCWNFYQIKNIRTLHLLRNLVKKPMCGRHSGFWSSPQIFFPALAESFFKRIGKASYGWVSGVQLSLQQMAVINWCLSHHAHNTILNDGCKNFQGKIPQIWHFIGNIKEFFRNLQCLLKTYFSDRRKMYNNHNVHCFLHQKKY